MYLCISILLFLLCIFKSNSKVVTVIALAWLWFLMSCSTGLADDAVNYSRYYNYSSFIGSTEVGYQLIMRLFSEMGVPFLTYKKIIALVEMVLLYFTTKGIGKCQNVALALYMFFPFCMDVVQMRNTLGLFIALYGMQFFFKEEKKKSDKIIKISNNVKYAFFIGIASLFHFLNLFYLVFLFGKRYKTKNILIVTSIICVFITNLISPRVLLSIGGKVGLETKISWAMMGNASNPGLYRLSVIRVIVYFLMFICIWMLDKYGLKRKNAHSMIDNTLIMNCNILIMAIIPLMQYSADFYRCQTGFTLINYIFFASHLKGILKHKISISDAVIIISLIAFAIINLYLLVLMSNNIHTVFEPVFINRKMW